MKIISPVKDYYDHEVARFGFDPTRVYDRRNTPEQNILLGKPWILGDVIYFAICGKWHVVTKIQVNGRDYFIHGNDVPKEYKEQVKHVQRYERHINYHGLTTDLNFKNRQPVLVAMSYIGADGINVAIPLLKNFGFASVIPSAKMYSDIYDYLGYLVDNPPIPDKQTNKEKILSHGFDARRSFRPKMK